MRFFFFFFGMGILIFKSLFRKFSEVMDMYFMPTWSSFQREPPKNAAGVTTLPFVVASGYFMEAGLIYRCRCVSERTICSCNKWIWCCKGRAREAYPSSYTNRTWAYPLWHGVLKAALHLHFIPSAPFRALTEGLCENGHILRLTTSRFRVLSLSENDLWRHCCVQCW